MLVCLLTALRMLAAALEGDFEDEAALLAEQFHRHMPPLSIPIESDGLDCAERFVVVQAANTGRVQTAWSPHSCVDENRRCSSGAIHPSATDHTAITEVYPAMRDKAPVHELTHTYPAQ